MRDGTEWKVRYVNYWIKMGFGFTIGFEAYMAGKDDFDYNENPEDCAEEDFSYYEP